MGQLSRADSTLVLSAIRFGTMNAVRFATDNVSQIPAEMILKNHFRRHPVLQIGDDRTLLNESEFVTTPSRSRDSGSLQNF